MTRRRRLTDQEWKSIFEIRCRTKRGEHVTTAKLTLCERALFEDPQRYKGLNADVFDATVPFGSSVKVKRM